MRMRSLVAVFSCLCGVVLGTPAARAASLSLDVGLARTVLPSGKPSTAHLRVSLVGGPPATAAVRPPANVCLAIDRSGSMQGEKIEHARNGAIEALRRLGAQDIVSVVAYDDVVRVLVPAARVTERGPLEERIRTLVPGGGTALFGGVVKCASELRKFAGRDRVSRIILISDGLANVGPGTPAALGELGAELLEEGISVATVGLGTGYNEDLMAELALRSDGSHVFVQHAHELARFLDDELEAVTSIVARDIRVKVTCPPGVRPLRVLGRPAHVAGRVVTARFGKVYGRRQHFFVVELQVEPGAAGRLADVDVSYRDLLANQAGRLSGGVAARFSPRSDEIAASTNPKILAELRMLEADAATEEAVQLLDRGEVTAAQQLFRRSAESLETAARTTGDKRLMEKMQRVRQQQREAEKAPRSPELRKSLKKDIMDDPLGGLKL